MMNRRRCAYADLVGGRGGVIELHGIMSLHEIVLPATKPETEWVRGRSLQKMSPQRTHSRLQGALTVRLTEWAAGRGEAGPEWRFRVAPPGEVRRPLVPDVAYIANERLRRLTDEELEIPPVAPDVAVEILSPDDLRADLDDKINVYLRSGSSLVIVVDPKRRVVELHDRNSTAVLHESGAIAHWALPGFHYRISELFSVLRRG